MSETLNFFVSSWSSGDSDQLSDDASSADFPGAARVAPGVLPPRPTAAAAAAAPAGRTDAPAAAGPVPPPCPAAAAAVSATVTLGQMPDPGRGAVAGRAVRAAVAGHAVRALSTRSGLAAALAGSVEPLTLPPLPALAAATAAFAPAGPAPAPDELAGDAPGTAATPPAAPGATFSPWRW